MGRERVSQAPHVVYVRDQNRVVHFVDVQSINQSGLAVRIGVALARFLATADCDVRYLAAPQFAFELRDRLLVEGVDPRRCVVIVARRCGKGWTQLRPVAEIAASDSPQPVAGKLLSRKDV